MTPNYCPTPVKVKFDTAADAEGRIQRGMASGGYAAGDREAYECRCGFWHVRPSEAGRRKIASTFPRTGW